MLLQLLFQNPLVALILIVSIVLSLTIHEFFHAIIADKLGDPTPKSLGRVSLNPLAHLDPLGTLLLVVAGFGWGKPVPISLLNLKNPKRDNAVIAAAGPVSNFLFAIVITIISHFVPYFLVAPLQLMALINLNLCFFNLIPLAPLDGEKVVSGFLPFNLLFQWQQIQQYGIVILMFLVFTNSISLITGPLIQLSLRLLSIF
jgi:Zn-dependent protease